MKAWEIIELVDEVKANHYDDKLKMKWLSDLDGLIWSEILSTHEDNPLPDGFPGYAVGRDEETELIVPAPYDSMYRWYLESQIDLANQEINKYNNSKALFNNDYLAFTDYYNRRHMPVAVARNLRFTSGRTVRTEYDPLST